MIHFVVSLNADGTSTVQRVTDASLMNMVRDSSFDPVNIQPDNVLDLHANLEIGAGIEFRRLLRIELRDDTIPKFSSPDEADAWMEQRMNGLILS